MLKCDICSSTSFIDFCALLGYVGEKMKKIILDLAELELTDTEVSILSAAILMSPSKTSIWNQILTLFQLDLVWFKRPQ